MDATSLEEFALSKEQDVSGRRNSFLSGGRCSGSPKLSKNGLTSRGKLTYALVSQAGAQAARHFVVLNLRILALGQTF